MSTFDHASYDVDSYDETTATLLRQVSLAGDWAYTTTLEGSTTVTRRGQDFGLHRRESGAVEVPISDRDDLSGVEARWRLTTDQTADAEIVREQTSGDGEVVVDAATATVRFELTPTEVDLDADSYYHELRLVDGGDERVVATGWLRVRESTTAD